MKKLYAVVSLCSFFLGYSQINLNSPETKSRTVTDPVSITLSQGFRAASSEVEFTARIQDSNPSNPPSSGGGGASPVNPSTPSGTLGSNLFHDTQGNIEVNGAGQLQFTLPIALPPGVKSVAPQVNLVYTSGSGNGIAGYGWNLSGITSITRTGKTLDRDGKKEGISLTYDDYYSFNGQRLVLVSGEYGKDGAIYTTEKHSNVKIKSKGTLSDKEWKGPEYWEVIFEDGSQAWYGSTQESRTPVEYNIVKWKDAQENYITYSYTQSNNVAVISSIKWGGNETLNKPHFNEMIFNYAERDLKESSYAGGKTFIQDKILTSIQVNTGGKQFKKYGIEYVDTGSIGYQAVKNITEYNSENQPANPVTFEYEKQPTVPETTTYDYAIKDTEFKKYGDFDFDGVVDFIEMTTDGRLFFKNSIYQNTEPVNLSYNPSEFTRYDFSKSSLITMKSKGVVKSNIGIVIPAERPRKENPKEIDYEFRVYIVNLKNRSLDFQYAKTLKFEDFKAQREFIKDLSYDYCNEINSKLSRMFSYDYNGDGISELVLQFSYEQHCGDLPPSLMSVESESINLDGDEKIEPIKLSYLLDDNTEIINLNSVNDTSYITNTFTTIKETNTNSYYFENEEPDVYESRAILFDLNETLSYQDSFYEFEYTRKKLEDWHFADFNGDGIDELYKIIGNKLSYVYNIKRDISKGYSLTSVFPDIILSGLTGNLIKADFNGDGKVDLAIPQGNGSTNWIFYMSTGKGFSDYVYNDFIYFSNNDEITDQDRHRNFPIEPYCEYHTQTYYRYNATDLDGDGKSEIVVTKVALRDHSWDSHRDREYTNVELFVYSSTGERKYKAIGHTILPFKYGQTKYSINHFPRKVIPFSPLFINRNNQQIVLIGTPYECRGEDCNRNYIIHLNYFNNPTIHRIFSIMQGGLRTEVDYKELDPNKHPGFYSGVKSEQYPYMELDKVSQSYAVSQLRQHIPSSTGGVEIRKQDFRYRGLISHLRGKGMIGFRQMARSSWYGEGYENTKVWSGAEIDPIREGLPIKEWSIKTSDEEKIFPKNLSFDNKELLSYKTTEYQIDEFISGNKVTGTKEGEKSQLVTAIVPTKTTTKDFLKEVTTTSTVEYNEHYLPVKTIQNTNQGFAEKITTLEYYPANLSGEGKDYHIGRPRSKTELVRAYGDSKGAKEEYEYENNQLKTLKTYNRDNSGYLQETYQYDGFGNIIEKKISNSIDGNTQTAKSKYDAQGRFVIEKIDNLELKTTISYNDWGQVLSQKDPLGNTLTSSYDAWGKLLTATHNLSGTTTHTYEKLNNHHVKTTTYSPDGGISISYTDNIGQNYKSTTKAFVAGQYISKEVRYDVLGRKVKESEPYYEGESASQWNTIEYDEYSRPKKATAFTGKIVETEYTKNTVKATETNANGRFKKQTFDALGNITSTEDKGGVIEFKYNAAGETIEAKYGSNIVTTKYDAWGRKIEFHDPSNGLYRYEYHHGFGLLTKEISPKGYKEYLYNDKGQLIRQIEKANNGTTDKQIEFSYNDKGMILSKKGVSKGKSFGSSIAYDSYGRVISSREEGFGKKYERKNVQYDKLNRVSSYEKSLTSSGKTTSVTIEHVYDGWSGELYELKDRKTDKTLWKMYLTNAKGQVVLAQLGNSGIHNTYDTNGFLSNVRHGSINPNQSQNQNPTDILNISYSFNAIKNELNSRNTTGALNILERFVYDDNNRLVNWTNPVTGGMHSNKYDAQGRIIENDQLGKIKFENSQKVYQPTGVTLNSAGEENLKNQLIQKIEYNENNDPVFIDGVKGDVRFEYGLTEMRQLMSFGGEFLPVSDALHSEAQGKYTRYYSEDGSFEITVDNKTGKEKHVLYIGGTPYESNIIFVKDYKEEEGSYKFLHKDYLGSILAISDEEGNKLEQRHYDAWGNLTHLQIGAGEVLTDKEQIAKLLENSQLIIDRGYTSHEHLWEVGVIHMNGRLYDPLLRRFLNADENIQDPHNTQIYNKYGYVTNNPLLYNDPSGEIIPFLIAVGIGAAAGLASYTVGILVTTGSLKSWNIGGALKATFWGAVSGAATFGLGELFSAGKVVQALGEAKFLVQAAAHGVSQGVLSVLQGGDFVQGFASGALGSLGAEMFGQVAGSWSNSTGGQILFGALSGGVGAELSGGNFWQGAVTGGIVAGLNHEMHKISRPTQNEEFYFSSQKELDEYINKRIGNKARIEKELKTKILLATDSNVEKHGYFLNGQGDMYNTSNGQMVGGITVPTGNNSSVIYIAPSAKSKGVNLPTSSNVFIVHELIHAMAFSKGYSYSEHAASTYTYAYFKAYGDYVRAETYKGDVRKYDPQLSWKKLPSFIKTGLKR